MPGSGPDVTCGAPQQDGRRESRGTVGPRAACVPVPLRSRRRKRKRTTSPSRRSPRLRRKRTTAEDTPKHGVTGQRSTGDPRFRFPDVWALKTVAGRCPAPETKSPRDVDNGDGVTSGSPETSPAAEAASGTGGILGSVMSLYDGCCSALWAALPDRARGGAPDDEDDEWAGPSVEKRVTCVSVKETPRR